MKKLQKFFVASMLLVPKLAGAVTFTNPGSGYLIDLGRFNYPNTFGGLLAYLINLAIGIVGLVSIVFIIYGGFQYITSAGNEEQAESGKKTLTNAIIGLVIVILSYTIVTIVSNALVGDVG